jgi:cobalt/nickel transport system permease protein
MHIPDNYLSPATCAVMGAAMAPVWAVAVKKVKAEVTKEKLPMLGVGAAFSFLVMMLNIPLPGGTTGHAVGGVLLAVLLGPWSACISVTIALLVQALLFGDGGVLAFGANCFNMAFALPFAGYFVYKLIRGWFPGKAGELAGAAVGAYAGLNLGALLTAIEFGLQPLLFRDAAGVPLYCPYPLAVAVPAMMIPHLLAAGFAEAAFTVAVFAFVRRASPGMVYEGAQRKMKPLYALVAALVVLSPLGLLAAGTAWGEWGADEIGGVITGGNELGFTPAGMANGFRFDAPLPDYTVGGLPEVAGYVLSAVAGAAILVILFKLLSLAKKNGTASVSRSNP